jgi:hypothetical protein
VVALRMRQDDRGEPADAHAPQLTGDVRLGRPFVHETRAAGLEERRVALPDVEERHAEPDRA